MQRKVTVPPKSGDEGDVEETRSFWDELGLPEPSFLDESCAPPVDRELIRQLLRHELSAERATELGKLIVLFRSWSQAHAEIVREELKRRRGEG